MRSTTRCSSWRTILASAHLRPDLTPEDVRFWSVFKYLVIYRPGTKPLEIVRVLHGNRDVRRWLAE